MLLALTSVCCFAFASCGGNNGTGNTGNGGSQNSQETSTPKTDEEKMQATLEKFEKEYNDGNFEGVLECMEPKMRNTMRALFNTLVGIAGGKLGVDVTFTDLFSLGVGMEEDDFIEFDIQDIACQADEGIGCITAYMNLAPATEGVMYIYFVEEKGEWLISDITDKKSSIGSGEEVLLVSMDSNEGFVDGLIKVIYEQEGKMYWGVANTQGEVVYSQETDYRYNYWEHLGNGAGWANLTGYEYSIITAEGEVIALNPEEEFDRVLCGENGLLWVYKYQTGINGAKALYGVLDAEGEWVVPMHELDFFFEDYFSSYQYMLGEDWFVYYYYTANRPYYQLYNYKTDVTVLLGNIAGEFENYIYAKNVYYLDENEESQRMEYARISPNGELEETQPFTYISDGKLIYERSEEDEETGVEIDQVEIYDIKTGTTVIYDDYSTDMVLSIKFVNNYGIVEIRGLDYNFYFTIIDENGVQQFEPIMGVIEKYSESRIVYSESRYDINMVVDLQGNVIVPKSAGYGYIGNFNGGLAVAQIEKTEEWVIIDTQGNVVIEKFTASK